MIAVLENDGLSQLLLQLQVVPQKQLDEAVKKSRAEEKLLYQSVLDLGFLTEQQLGKFVADAIDLPYVSLGSTKLEKAVLQILPERVARAQRAVVYKIDAKQIFVATDTVQDPIFLDLLGKKAGRVVRVSFALPEDLEQAFSFYSDEVKESFEKMLTEYVEEASQDKGAEPPVIHVVDQLFFFAQQKGASDIHIEPYEEYSLIRFRIDGVLHDILQLPLHLHERIVTRIKVLAHLRTDEHATPQDGKLRIDVDEKDAGLDEIDVRVSVVPLVLGEKVVMRLLSESSRRFSLGDLGLSAEKEKTLQAAYKEPNGMILVTGPTGSGKTTTLYAVLKQLNKRERNIMTIEDPVEYAIEGISQIQVNAQTNLTFANGLRSIVRQDPNIILVGEIRDPETAGIAVNAALTGHLVLSSLHTNDAATTLPRLREMGVEPYVIASTINVIVAQRLVRTLCADCRVSVDLLSDEESQNDLKTLDPDLRAKAFPEKANLRLYRGKGCANCQDSGYSGRIGIFEVLTVTDAIKAAIMKEEDAATIAKIARSEGMQTMLEAGLEQAKQGVTSLEEVLRVTKD